MRQVAMAKSLYLAIGAVGVFGMTSLSGMAYGAGPKLHGERLLFVATKEGGSQIHAMSGDGSSLRVLTSGPGDNVEPAWSPDGARVLFTSQRDGNMEVYVMDADGSNVKRLTNERRPDNAASWSPDGRRIAFRSYRDRHANLFVMNADGSGLQRLTDTSYDKGPPIWSPDGRQLVFLGFVDGKGGRIRSQVLVVSADGTGLKDLTSVLSDDPKSSPSWSPDGGKILFAAEKNYSINIYTMNADGTNPVRLTDNRYINSMPVWSPDGKRIAFVSGRGEDKLDRAHGDIFVMNADGTGVTNVTRHPKHDDTPAWVADGSGLYFLSLRDGISQIYRMSLSGGEAMRLSAGGSQDQAPVPFLASSRTAGKSAVAPLTSIIAANSK